MAFGISFPLIEAVYDYFVSYVLKAIHWFSTVDVFFVKNIPMALSEVFVLFCAVYFLRFVIVEKQAKHYLRFGFCLLLFFALKLFLDFVSFGKPETLLVQNFKQKTLIDTRNGRSVFYLDENSNLQNIENYIISPYISSRRIKKYEVVKIPENIKQITINNQKFIVD